jgi:hypothetical protein
MFPVVSDANFLQIFFRPIRIYRMALTVSKYLNNQLCSNTLTIKVLTCRQECRRWRTHVLCYLLSWPYLGAEDDVNFIEID